MTAIRAMTYDTSAIGLSTLCLVHCLALPIVAAGVPVLASAAEAEWVHRAFVLLAVPISFMAMARGGGRVFTGLALVGLSLLITGAFVEQLHDYETPLTVAGALTLAFAHIFRWRRSVLGL